MAKFVVEIELGNDAMKTGNDVADAITRIASTIRHLEGPDLDPGARRGSIMDPNGNKVGVWRVDP